jgi:hypothetical protein
LIVRPELWWESGNLRSVRYAIAARKKDSSYTWADVMQLPSWGTFLPSAATATIEAFCDWSGPVYSLDTDSYPLQASIGTGNNDGGSHQAYFENVNMFITEMDPSVPPVVNPVYDYSSPFTVLIDNAWSHQFASDLFTDANFEDVLTYSAELSDGNALPAWLSFDSVTRTLSGTALAADEGSIILRITATDASSQTVDQLMALDIGHPVTINDPVIGGTELVQYLSPYNADASLSGITQNLDGTVVMTAPDGSSPMWDTIELGHTAGKKLIVKWEYDTLDDGSILKDGTNSGNSMSITTYDRSGYSWKYFQIWGHSSYPNQEAFFRFGGSSYNYPTSPQGVDLYNSQFRMESTFDGSTRTTVMKIRPVGGTKSFDEMTSADHGGGYYYLSSDYTTTGDARINISAYPTESDASGDFIKFKYLRFELVDE